MAIAPMRTDGAPGRGAPGTVLLIDDEPLLLRSLRRTLEGEGYRTALAESADAAESRLAEIEPDVVLLDLGLGRDGGLALLERLKREWPEVEVIVITGNASIESAVGCIRERRVRLSRQAVRRPPRAHHRAPRGRAPPARAPQPRARGSSCANAARGPS